VLCFRPAVSDASGKIYCLPFYHVRTYITYFHSKLGLQDLSVADIRRILDPYVGTEDPIVHINDIPNGVSDISAHLKFVDRDEEIKQLMKNMQNLYNLITNRRQYAELKKHLAFPAAVGTAGKGKTTFARRAYENPAIYSDVVEDEVLEALRECHAAGR